MLPLPPCCILQGVYNEGDEIAALESKLEAAELPAEASKVAMRDLARLKRMQASQPEYTVRRLAFFFLALVRRRRRRRACSSKANSIKYYGVGRPFRWNASYPPPLARTGPWTHSYLSTKRTPRTKTWLVHPARHAFTVTFQPPPPRPLSPIPSDTCDPRTLSCASLARSSGRTWRLCQICPGRRCRRRRTTSAPPRCSWTRIITVSIRFVEPYI